MNAASWSLSPIYLLMLSVSAHASVPDSKQGHNLILASFDTELNNPTYQTARPPTTKNNVAAKPAATPAPAMPIIKHTAVEQKHANPQSLVAFDSNPQLMLKDAVRMAEAGLSIEFDQAMTELEPRAFGNPLLTADIARVWIKHGGSGRAASFLARSKPLDATSTVLYGWALLNSHQDEKLTRLLGEIDNQVPHIDKPRLQTQLANIRKSHIARLTQSQLPNEEHAASPVSVQKPMSKTAQKMNAVILEDINHARPVQKISDLRNAAGLTFDMQDYKRAHAILVELESLGVMDRDILILRAWDEFNLNNYEESGNRFASLYQSSPDKHSAEGLFYSYSKLNRVDELRPMVREGTLSGLLNNIQRETGSPKEATAPETDVLTSRRPNREKYDPFNTLGISHADMYFSQRSKTGDNGTSRLVSRKEPGVAYGWQSEDNNTDYRMQMDRVTLNSGVLDPALAIVGSDAAYGGIALPVPQKNSMSGFEPVLIARHDTEGATYSGEIGLTPSGGAVASTLMGRANGLKYLPWGTVSIDGYMQPVRDSILSYTGMNDPYGAVGAWGRVVKTGIAPGVNWNITDKWSASSMATLEALTGVNTRNNSHYGVRAGIGYSFDVKKFEYLSADISASYDHYQNNQNLFTYGNGGYYSPQSAINVGPSITFLTRNFYPVVLNGRASMGYGKASTINALRFPLDPANPVNIVAPGAGFYSSNSQGLNYNFSIQALWNVQKDLQLGCAFAYSQADASAPAYKENNLSLFARMPFDGIVK